MQEWELLTNIYQYSFLFFLKTPLVILRNVLKNRTEIQLKLILCSVHEVANFSSDSRQKSSQSQSSPDVNRWHLSKYVLLGNPYILAMPPASPYFLPTYLLLTYIPICACSWFFPVMFFKHVHYRVSTIWEILDYQKAVQTT